MQQSWEINFISNYIVLKILDFRCILSLVYNMILCSKYNWDFAVICRYPLDPDSHPYQSSLILRWLKRAISLFRRLLSMTRELFQELGSTSRVARASFLTWRKGTKVLFSWRHGGSCCFFFLALSCWAEPA